MMAEGRREGAAAPWGGEEGREAQALAWSLCLPLARRYRKITRQRRKFVFSLRLHLVRANGAPQAQIQCNYYREDVP